MCSPVAGADNLLDKLLSIFIIILYKVNHFCVFHRDIPNWLVGWLFWILRPFETVFQSISGRLPKRGRNRKERIDESKNVQTTPTRTHCMCSRPLPYYYPNCRTPQHWKFTQHHQTTQPSPGYSRKYWAWLIKALLA